MSFNESKKYDTHSINHSGDHNTVLPTHSQNTLVDELRLEMNQKDNKIDALEVKINQLVETINAFILKANDQ